MEWLHKDSLLREQDLKVLKFVEMQSTVLSCHGSASATDTLKTDEEWKRWLDKQGGPTQSGLTLMLGGRKSCRIPGIEASYLPFSGPAGLHIFCDRVVPTMQIHSSVSRVINRNTTATFSATTTKHAGHDRTLLVYNCRSSAEWPDDMALTVTHSPENKSTQAVVFGCSDMARKKFTERLSGCDFKSYHPLTIPTIFAEIERDRHFKLVNPLMEELIRRAVNIARPHRPHAAGRSSAESGPDKTPGSGNKGNSATEAEDLMQVWLKVSYLKRGLETWRQQLEKMIAHCEELNQCRLRPLTQRFDDSAGSTPVNNVLSIDVDTKMGDTDRHFDYLADLEDCGQRVHQRLMELKCEYDEKIGRCSTIVEGLVLATQLEWNQIGQDDAVTNLTISGHNLSIAKSTQDDSKQMRSIAVLTMIFLPATFVASLFSMSFFDLGPNPGHGKVSPWIWLYFVVTVGFTGVTLSVWYMWTQKPKDVSVQHPPPTDDIEKLSPKKTMSTIAGKRSASI